MKNKIKYSSVLLSMLLASMAFAGCNNEESNLSENMSSVTTEIYTSDVSSDTSSQDFISSEVSSETMQSEIVSSKSASSSAVSSNKEESVSSKASTSSKQPVSSQPPKPTSSQPVKEPASSESPNFGERMDEAEVDRIIAEGIEYAESKGMTWRENYTVESNGYYNPAFSGAGAEIFKRDLFYHIDQVYDIALADEWYVEGNSPYYKIVKGEFEEPGYWYGFVLY